MTITKKTVSQSCKNFKGSKWLPPILESIDKEHCTLLRNLGHYVYDHRLPSLMENMQEKVDTVFLPPSSSLLDEPFLSCGIFEMTLMEQKIFVEPAHVPSIVEGVNLFSAPCAIRPLVVEYLFNRFPMMHKREHLWTLQSLHPRRGKAVLFKDVLRSCGGKRERGIIPQDYYPLPLRFETEGFSCDILVHVLPSFPFESLSNALALEPLGGDFHCDFEIPLSLCFGSTHLSIQEVRNLERGDILLVETPTTIGG